MTKYYTFSRNAETEENNNWTVITSQHTAREEDITLDQMARKYYSIRHNHCRVSVCILFF